MILQWLQTWESYAIAAISGAVWWCWRKLRKIDELEKRVELAEKVIENVEPLDKKVDGLDSKLSKINGKLDILIKDRYK